MRDQRHRIGFTLERIADRGTQRCLVKNHVRICRQDPLAARLTKRLMHRIRLAHSLIMNYGLYKKMEIYRAKPASKYEMTQFHTDEYVDLRVDACSPRNDVSAKSEVRSQKSEGGIKK